VADSKGETVRAAAPVGLSIFLSRLSLLFPYKTHDLYFR